MTRRLWAVLSGSMLLAAIGCSSDPLPLTQLMVVVDSDMTQVDSVRVKVEGMGDPKIARADDLKKHPLPRSVAIVHTGGPLGPIDVTAEAFAGGSTLVSRHAQISFVRGRNLMLTLQLDQSCIDMHCDSGETCIAGSCESDEVDATDLSDWSGKLPNHRDAGGSGSDAGDAGDAGGNGGSSGAGSGGGGQAGAKPAGQGGGPSAGMGGKPAAGSGGSTPPPTCSGCKFDSATSMPHGQLSCDDGSCTLHCDAGYTDADRSIGNGCEKSASAFGWKASNVDPDNATLAAAIAPLLSIDCSATLDLGSGALASTVGICSQQLQPILLPQAGGPDLVVFATRHLSVTTGSVFRFTGSRPVAIVVFGDADIEGELDVSAIGTTGAAGSNFVCNPGLGGNGASASHSGGGGGGGFGTNGADGAGSTPSGAAAGVGGAASSSASLVPLRGGCSGGLGGKGDGGNAPGGASGGAIQISVSGKLHVGGTIAAAGGGGQPADDDSFVFGDGGGGGGSGGAILLEATILETVSGAWITTNGGGGGEGRVLNNTTDPGADGAHASMAVAAGGSGSSSGGNGAAGETAATAPPTCSNSLCAGGGGGGGLGRVVLRSADCQLGGSTIPATTCSAH